MPLLHGPSLSGQRRLGPLVGTRDFLILTVCKDMQKKLEDCV